MDIFIKLTGQDSYSLIIDEGVGFVCRSEGSLENLYRLLADTNNTILIEEPSVHSWLNQRLLGALLFINPHIILVSQNNARTRLYGSRSLSTDMLLSEVSVRLGKFMPKGATIKQKLDWADCLILSIYYRSLKNGT